MLNHKEVGGISSAILADQIAGRKKAKEKLPAFYNTSGIIYPPSINLEQTSSEATAIFKTSIVKRLFPSGGITAADLTGGFGVDTFFLSKAFREMHFVEPEGSILEIARHNHERLGASNIQYHHTTAENFIAGFNQSCDFFYADPSRRTAAGKKVYTLADSEPDLVNLSARILSKAPNLLVKTSPLLDIQAGMVQLKTVKSIFVVSVNNECKEVLFLCESNFRGEPTIETVNLSPKNSQFFEFKFSQERAEETDFSDPLKYLYEPNASILKAGAFKSIAHRFDLKKIQKNTHLYTSNSLMTEFPGRIFVIENMMRPDPSETKKYFPDGKANVATRNYPLTVDALKKKTGLKDGGEKYLIGFSGQQKKFLVVATRQ